ncbi:hypothetical protein KFZ58_17030 [Virgibacillus sp. NKC19-16]|uniref:hypothetical protein n=1 Tax=Virgibacillus salidurans TaxID=2831673 RepID=UPI001F274979|nr:hypothetical protein [Virgibacillus sp. NKC19-16]UJL46043.1 hypothetical protein KFZ58_17030 [Virgibacillus sp. NKC19-16]
MATKNKSAGSLVKDIFLSIVAVVIVVVVFYLFDEPSSQEDDTELASLFGLLPDEFFAGTFAPFDMVIFNLVTAVLIIYTIIRMLHTPFNSTPKEVSHLKEYEER